MPLLTRWFLKAALLYLVLAFFVGVLLMLRGVLDGPPLIGVLSPVYFHLFMVGWVTQIIFGIAYWMLPKYSKEKPRGYEPLGWATFGLLNVGLLLRAVGEPMQAFWPGLGWGWLLAVSAVLQWLAGMAFVLNTWRRVKVK